MDYFVGTIDTGLPQLLLSLVGPPGGVNWFPRKVDENVCVCYSIADLRGYGGCLSIVTEDGKGGKGGMGEEGTGGGRITREKGDGRV